MTYIIKCKKVISVHMNCWAIGPIYLLTVISTNCSLARASFRQYDFSSLEFLLKENAFAVTL
jgi:hypothetical protein